MMVDRSTTVIRLRIFRCGGTEASEPTSDYHYIWLSLPYHRPPYPNVVYLDASTEGASNTIFIRFMKAIRTTARAATRAIAM